MTGRNERCPCGSGKKYKRCCLSARAAIGWTQSKRSRRVPAEALAQFQQHQRAEAARHAKFGETRPIVSFDTGEHRIVAVGNTVHWAKTWQTFPDFLFSYIEKVLGPQWGTTELAKPEAEQHPIIQWCGALRKIRVRDKAQQPPDERGVRTSILDGPSRAYLLLAYDLYVVSGHATLQESLVKRLRHRDQFQGARYELFVAATLIRAGCDLAFEDESDPSSKHVEFVATHRITRHTISVEAKSRHRPGTLGRVGSSTPAQGFRLGISHLLRAALKKRPTNPYVIFVDMNMPPELASPLSLVNWRDEVHQTVRAVDTGVSDGGLIVGSGFSMLAVTNTPDHYGELGGDVPGYVFNCIRPSRVARALPDMTLLNAIEQALEQAANVPQEFPVDR